MRLSKKNIAYKGVYVLISLFVIFASCKPEKGKMAHLEVSGQNSPILKKYISELRQCRGYVDTLLQSESRKSLEDYYVRSREAFKKIEPIMAFHDVENYKFFNAPNILKVEEEDATDIKIMEPNSFQVLEEAIFTDRLDLVLIHRAANLIKNRLMLLEKNTDLGYMKDYHFLWMLRNGFLRVALTGITGFDSPVLEQSLAEGIIVYQSLLDYLAIKKDNFKDEQLFKSWEKEINATIFDLSKSNFTDFDRYDFIKNHTHKQLELYNRTAEDWEADFPFTLALKNDMQSLFSYTTFNMDYFADRNSGEITSDKIALGKSLFNDTNLSTSGTISCASCHNSDKAFADGKVKSLGQDRNSPTLTYAALQQGFFYDRRAGSLEGQIVSVVNNDTEFHTDLKLLAEAVQKKPAYKTRFKEVYRNGITDFNIRNAIANYVRAQSKFNSKFDKNINGTENTLSQNEINGFNLFMGKAKCATCHFAPIFNGTVPPSYTESEIELLGVPMYNDTINATIDSDLGVYNVFGTEQRKFFFKTPTIRNIEKTAPYMHNGVYGTLEEVVDFYNRGGGVGIGIDQEYQTLPPDSLNLSDQEQKDLVSFMKSLTDALENKGMEHKFTGF